MRTPYVLRPSFSRFCSFFKKEDNAVPVALFTLKSEKPDLTAFPLPLPSLKKDYTCFAAADNGVMWYGATSGLTRYAPNADFEDEVIMYFSAERDLLDDDVKAVLPDSTGAWVLTETGVSHIELKILAAEEKAELLLNETLEYVERRGMVSQREMKIPRDFTSVVPYAFCDNDGCFTAGFSIGEIYRYATLKRQLGEDNERVKAARAIATRSCEACLLLMYISKRGDGFVARTYMAPDEPVPDDGLFFRISGDKATCVETRRSVKSGIVGTVIDAKAPVPERLAKLYTTLGHTDDGVVYKADTSSDEITLHFLHLYIAHKFLGEGDPELDSLIKEAACKTMSHIIDHGYELHDYHNKPTTWAKWSEEYFSTLFGWTDACLNSAEVLMYLQVVMNITGEQGKWREAYDNLVKEGYADLVVKHYDRAVQTSQFDGGDVASELMYGDNMLAVASFWGLLKLEKDEALREKYIEGFKTWRSSLEREHNPGYDFPFALATGEEIDMDKIALWFRRTNTSRLAAGVNVQKRADIARVVHPSGYSETSWLLPPDERFIAKYDRNPLEFVNVDSGGTSYLESCYVYTFAYWIGRYYNLIEG